MITLRGPGAAARVETNQDAVVTGISSNRLEVRPPSAEEREQHVASFDSRFTKANSRLVVTHCGCAEGQHEWLDVLTLMAIDQRFVEASRPILTARPHVRRDQSQRHPVVARAGPQRRWPTRYGPTRFPSRLLVMPVAFSDWADDVAAECCARSCESSRSSTSVGPTGLRRTILRRTSGAHQPAATLRLRIFHARAASCRERAASH